MPDIMRIPSWEEVIGPAFSSRPEKTQEDDPEAAAAALQQLVELGYLEAPGEDVRRDITRARAEQKFNLACSYIDGKQPAQALILAEELAKQFPREIRHVVLAGQAAVSAGDAAALDRAIQALVLLKPEHNQLVLFRAFFCWLSDDIPGALEHFKAAAAAAPRDPWLYCRVGRAYLRLRRWPEAEEAFRKSIALDPDNAENYYGLSVAIPRQGRLEEGIECGLRAISLLHDFPLAHFQLGAVLARVGWYERALQAFEICLAMRPDFALAHRYVSLICNQLGRLEIANKHRTIASRIVGEGLPQPSVD
jgi:tetratricopeptide (TPR) repeat protein